MKILSATLLSLLFLFSCTSTENIVVESDKRLDTNFNEFKTFKWASHAANADTEFFSGDQILKEEMRDAIMYEMKAKGYQYDSNDPDLIVNFRAFEDDTEYIGYTEVYKDDEYWSGMEMRKEMIGLVPDAEVRNSDDKKIYYLKEGTILIDILNAETSELVWTGYASGIYDGNPLKTSDRRKIGDAVAKIFEEYDYRGTQL